MCKLRNPLDPIIHIKETFSSPLKALPFESKSGEGTFGRLGPKETSATAGAPPPTPAPPMTVTSSEVLAAKRKTRTDAAGRKGYLASLIAGDTGGYKSATGRKSLLGGGG